MSTDVKKEIKTIEVIIPSDTDEVTHVIKLIFPDGFRYSATPNALKGTLQDHIETNTVSFYLPKEEFMAKLRERGLPSSK